MGSRGDVLVFRFLEPGTLSPPPGHGKTGPHVTGAGGRPIRYNGGNP